MSDNEEVPTPEDRKLFNAIAKDIKTNPKRYSEAGKWLDEYCSEGAYWQRQEDKLKELREQQRRISEIPVQRVKQLEEKIRGKRTPALIVRFQEARDYLFEKYKDQPFISEDIAKRIIIITWILTDPDAEKANLVITQFEKWSWEPVDDVTKLSQAFAQFLWCKGGRVYGPWMNLVRIAWSKLAEGMDEEVSLSTKDEKKDLVRSFFNNLLRASIKHIPIVGSFLYDVIYGTLDNMPSQERSGLRPKLFRSRLMSEKQKMAAKDKKDGEKYTESVSLKAAKITLISAVIILVSGILTSPLWRPLLEKWTDDKKTLAEKKLPRSLKEICQDINSRPLVQKEQTAKRYIGMRIKREPLSLYHISEEDETFLMLMVFTGESYIPFSAGWGVSFEVKKNDYPELAGAKKGVWLYVSGQIQDIGEAFIHLSEVSLSFD